MQSKKNNACNVASKNMRLVLVRRLEKRNRTDFYRKIWEVLKVSRMPLVCIYKDILGQKTMYENLI